MNLESEDWSESMMDDVFGDVAEVVRLLVFLVDCSGSMEGTIIGTVNSIMEELLVEMEKDQNHKYIAVVSFGETVNWMPNEVVALENFSGWKRLHASNLSNMGEAFGQLGERLSRQNWCPTGQNGIEGVFVLFSDGLATDHYETGMEKLKKSPIFSNGIRLAVNFSEIYDEEVLLDFAGDRTRILNMKSNEIGKAEKKILSVIAE